MLALFGIGGVMFARGLPALSHIGFSEIFGNNFSSQYGSGENIFGLRPAIWGTVEVTFIAMAVAFPVSLALALIATEFQLGPISRVVRLVLGILSGIPSIIYALAAIVFVTAVMIPKFAGDATGHSELLATLGKTELPSDVPNAMPWGDDPANPNGTLLGGVLIGLLVIPFLAPMVEDAIRSVPKAQKEASLALGGTRMHTLRRIVLPYASPGLISAAALASLKAMGDVVIALFVIGFEAPSVPNPLYDVFQRNPPLPAVGANLLGGAASATPCQTLVRSTVVESLRNGEFRCDAAYFNAMLLVIIAAVVLVVAFYLQNRFRKRYAR